MPLDVPSQLALMQEKGHFNKEIEFFRSIEPMLTENFKGGRWGPKCYFAKEGVLIFEDLNTMGYSNRSKLLNEQSVKAAVATIARFHATSLLAEEQNDGIPLKDMFPDALKESDFDRSERSLLNFTVAINMAIAIANNLGLDSTGIRKVSERVFDISKTSKTQRNVVSHGDLWSNNLMFNNDDNCILIDFQLIRYAPLTQDVMLLLHSCTTKEFRQQYGRKSIEFYHKILVNTLRDNSFKGGIPTLGELLLSAEEQKLPALVIAVMYNQAQMMNGKAATILDNSQNYKDYYTKDRRSFVFKHVAENEEYNRKMEENVRELVEFSMSIDTLPTVS